MLRASRVLLSAARPSVKLTTGIVGLDVVPNAKEVLIKLYEKTLNDVKIIPEDVEYRKTVEQFTKYRLDVVKKHDDVWEIEKEIGTGQVEELIEDAKGELILIPEYASWKLWEQEDAMPMEDSFDGFYEDLEFIDPDSVAYLGLRELAQRKRAEGAARRKAASDAAAAQAAAKAAPAAAPASK